MKAMALRRNNRAFFISNASTDSRPAWGFGLDLWAWVEEDADGIVMTRGHLPTTHHTRHCNHSPARKTHGGREGGGGGEEQVHDAGTRAGAKLHIARTRVDLAYMCIPTRAQLCAARDAVRAQTASECTLSGETSLPALPITHRISAEEPT
jgi:hypothetical protein